MISNQSFSMPAGDTVTIELPISAEDGVELLGSTVYYAVSLNEKSPKLFTKTNGSGITISNATGGGILATIRLNHADTKALRPTRYYHEATVVGGDAAITTVMRGYLILSPTLIARQL